MIITKTLSRKHQLIYLLFALMAGSCGTASENEPQKQPNIVYILADDLGYGDVSIYNSQSKTQTPYIDRLAGEGMRFTDAHSPSSVCTPTRYGILTGRYCWRSRLPVGVLRGYGRSLLEKDRQTVAGLLNSNGYTTGVVGKWHLGLDWTILEAYRDSLNAESVAKSAGGVVTEMNADWLDFDRKPTDGPLNHGFDYSFILPASLDMPPYCFLENDSLLSRPDAYTEGNDLNTGYYGAFWRAGRMSPDFQFEQVLPTFTAKAEQFIADHAQDEQPFFLYLPLSSPHTPWVPTAEYEGSSQAGPYGDFVQMVDATVGRILASLEAHGLVENTILIFTSDNGPFWRQDKVETYQHRAAGPYRGMKADIYEGGHRVPFIVRWPGHIRAGSQSAFPTTHTNLMATCADLLGVDLAANTGEDSQSIMPVLLSPERQDENPEPIIHHSSKGFFAIRKGNWKLVDQLGSGGFTEPTQEKPAPDGPVGQLYNLAEDPEETTNLYLQRPEIVQELSTELDRIKERSAPLPR